MSNETQDPDIGNIIGKETKNVQHSPIDKTIVLGESNTSISLHDRHVANQTAKYRYRPT
jgi:hypothetical protein